MEKKVSAVITTYHRKSALLKRANISVLDQTYPNMEVIVVDDNENDSAYSEEVKELCEQLSVLYIKQNGNQGACAARNLGIEHASGEYIGFLDDDDEWLPEKIEKQVFVFQQESERLGLVYCKGLLIDEEHAIVNDYYNFKSPLKLTYEMMLYNDYIGTTTNPLIKKECFQKVGGFGVEQPARQDYEMWLRITREYEIAGVEDRLFKHYIHFDNQITKEPMKAYLGYRNIYWRYKKDYCHHAKSGRRLLDSLIKSGKQCGKKSIYYRLRRKYLIKMYKLNP